MKIDRRFTADLAINDDGFRDVFAAVEWSKRTSRITNPDGSVVFEMTDAEIPAAWSQLATDIMVSKYFRKAGVPQIGADGQVERHEDGTPVTGPERSARQVISRLADCWADWGREHGYFDTPDDASAFRDELCHMLLNQMAAPNSPQWFNTGLHNSYGITGPAQGHYFVDPADGETKKATSAYERPQPHACFIQSVDDDLVGHGGIMDLWTREARLFKYGSGTGTNFTKVRGENEPLSGGGKSSGLMSFLKIGDRAAGAIKSGGTTRRAAKMVCLDLDHPDIEDFVNWKVREELKVAALAEGMKHLSADQKELAEELGLKLDYDFNGEAYYTVSGQNSNNSVRIPNAFFKALETDADWTLIRRTDGEVHKTIKARDLWEQISQAAWRCADPGVQYDTTINEWHTCPSAGRINASNPCVTGDTRVLTPGGIWRRIDEMIHLPARVVTNLESQAVHFVEGGAFPTGTREVFELTTESGYQIKLTKDHKVWTRDRGWIEAGHLTRNDEVRLISQPAAVERVGEPSDPKLFHLAGFLLSDANGDGSALDLAQCGLTNDTQIADYGTYVADNWGETARVRRPVRDRMGAGEAVGNVAGDTVVQAVAEPEPVVVSDDRRMLGRLGAFARTPFTGGRRLSGDAFTAGLAAQKHLLRGLFTADGIVTHETVGLRTGRLGLLRDVQTLLIGFGIRAQVGGTDGDAVLRVDPACLSLFQKHIGFLSTDKDVALAQAVANRPDAGAACDNWDRVAGLEPLGHQQVFDLTEPVTSSFVANGVTVHNCSEYMFLDDTACNLASLNL
ncbi:MAG: LAGLIDADG family homing endonuclease, partial [Planctomycetota bacterium]